MKVTVRPASVADAPAIQAIYAHHVLQGLGTSEEAPPSTGEMANRLADVTDRGLPWIVAADEAERVLGYAYAAPFRLRAAYGYTLEAVWKIATEGFRAERTYDWLRRPSAQALDVDRAEPWPMAKIAKKTKRYPSDLTDEEWEQIAPLMPKPGRRGRPREVEFREVINAVRYLVRSGGGWRMLPIHFGPWQTVYSWFRELARRFLFQTIHDLALMMDRERAGREASPSAGVIDSQSVKAPQGKTRGYDAGKKIVGRKRHIAVDTDGRLLMVHLTPADISDSAGAQVILDGIRRRWPWVKHLFADGAYDRLKLMDKATYLDFVIEVIRRCDDQKGFEVLPRRWVVERTFGWMTRWRRLVRDYEACLDVSEAMILVAMGGNLLRRTTHP